MSREVTLNKCPFKMSFEPNIVFSCNGEKCEWWDVDEGCCCIRVAVRALEDLASLKGSQ